MGLCMENVGDAFVGYVFGNLDAASVKCEDIYQAHTHDM
jgi:hypothetical protein